MTFKTRSNSLTVVSAEAFHILLGKNWPSTFHYENSIVLQFLDKSTVFHACFRNILRFFLNDYRKVAVWVEVSILNLCLLVNEYYQEKLDKGYNISDEHSIVKNGILKLFFYLNWPWIRFVERVYRTCSIMRIWRFDYFLLWTWWSIYSLYMNSWIRCRFSID